jgi:alkylation response protein AidB-like acyl-CoA dehydrogenase
MLTQDYLLSNELLSRFGERCAVYDRENRFFHEDFADLKAAGYLTMAVPAELGGRGLTLTQVAREQRRLGYHAPATALGINMHLYWVGAVADLWRQGDKSLEWLLKEVMAGEVFNSGHSERGNDFPVQLSTSKAERVKDGFRITGHKMFGSMAPVFTRYGCHAMWADAEGGPKVVHMFMPRDAANYRIVETWDTMGMRATCSHDVILDGVFVPDRYVARIVPVGGQDFFMLAMLAWALMGWSNIYYGMAQRAIDLAIASLKSKKLITLTRTLAYHPEFQHRIAQMVMAFDTIGPQLEQVAEDWTNGVDHGLAWPAKIVSAKHNAVETAWNIVDWAMDVSGGAGMFKSNELERLFRDARCGRFHPANMFLAHEIVAKTALGIDMGEQPRWG